jgi:hypothetical protein
LYCSGHAPLEDGRILFMGGARYKNLGEVGDPGAFLQDEFGLNYPRLYDPRTKEFVRVPWPNPAGPAYPDPRPDEWVGYEKGDMWYPTNTRLPGGKILVNGGMAKWVSVLDDKKFDFQNRSVTIFDPEAYLAERQPWSVWVSHDKAPREAGIDVFDYPHVFLLPKPVTVGGIPRHVLIYGGSGPDPRDRTKPAYVPGVALLSLDRDVPEEKRFTRPKNAARPQGGMLNETTASMTAEGLIVIIGGGASGLQEGRRIDIYNPYEDDWHSVDLRSTRQKPSSTLLPDGNILIVNGEEFYRTPENIGDLTRPALFDPRTRTVTELAPWKDDPEVRGYHAVSLLLNDGRVLIGGGRIYQGERGLANGQGKEGAYRIGCERPELRIFSPPYLFEGANHAPRSVIGEGIPEKIVLGGPAFRVKFTGPAPRPNGGVVLMALGAYTHSFDQNQRLVPLTAVSGPDEVTVTPPADGWMAPEGKYNLFLISDKGVPSVSKPVQVVVPMPRTPDR